VFPVRYELNSYYARNYFFNYVIIKINKFWSLIQGANYQVRIRILTDVEFLHRSQLDVYQGDCNKGNEELCDLYSSPRIIRIIKSRRRWAGM
jgi:hypothetical protein